MLGFEDWVVNKINTVPGRATLRHRRYTNDYISIKALESSSRGIHEGSTEVWRYMGTEERLYLVATALDAIVLGVSEQSATLVFSSLF